MSLHILGSGDGLQNIGDIYEMYKNVLSKIVRKIIRPLGNITTNFYTNFEWIAL